MFVTPVKTGVHPLPSTWIPFFNGMTDTVRHIGLHFYGNDAECD